MVFGNTKAIIDALEIALNQATAVCGIKRIAVHLDQGTCSIAKLFECLEHHQKIYIKSVKQRKEYVAIGCLKRFSDSSKNFRENCKEEIKSLIQNAQCRMYGGQMFDAVDLAKDDIWRGLEECEYWLPILELEHGKDGIVLFCNWSIDILGDRNAFESVLEPLLRINNLSEKTVYPSANYQQSVPGLEAWTQGVNAAVNSIKEKELHKVVLAKQGVFTSSEPVHISQLASIVAALEPKCSVYVQQFTAEKGFIAITPETLFLREGQDICVDVVAGTIHQSSNREQRRALAVALCESDKDQNEHYVVHRFVINQMSLLCNSFHAADQCDVLELAHVQHLKRTVSGKLKQGIDDFDLMEYLHPTPAVSGYPIQESKAYIRAHEPFNRGFYAGALGIMGSSATEYLVGIRSCFVDGKTVYVFSGAGIVEKSEADSEWAEVCAKAESYSHILSS